MAQLFTNSSSRGSVDRSIEEALLQSLFRKSFFLTVKDPFAFCHNLTLG